MGLKFEHVVGSTGWAAIKESEVKEEVEENTSLGNNCQVQEVELLLEYEKERKKMNETDEWTGEGPLISRLIRLL